ncbi:MAG: 16S rRNA (guanine(527)-N(7))-methyltransferase RsmG [Jatrophihabitantaceae bacterium]
MDVPAAAPEPPPQAATVFGDRLGLACRFAQLLATGATVRGLIGPRENRRLWERHLLNGAVVTDLLPPGARVVDVGSGAGLPGIAMAIRRPDLRVDLVEPLQRRVDFLREVVQCLCLTGTVRVVRGRAEDRTTATEVGNAAWVTARAVAPMDQLVRWCLPLLHPGGQLLAIKGSTAMSEVTAHRSFIHEIGGREIAVVRCGAGVLVQPTVVVVVRRDAQVDPRRRKGQA